MSVPRVRPVRGQALFALASVVFLVGAMAWLDRIGPRASASLAPGAAASGAWFCPHGGRSELSVALYLANPGSATVTARVTKLGSGPAGSSESYDVPAGSTLRIDQVPEDRGSATYVEYFGGWIGAAWVAFTDEGVAAEPCAADAARRWFLADGTTQLGEDAYVIVANPFAVSAVLNVVLYTSDGAPIRNSDWTDLVIPARRSTALHLNTMSKGEPVVGVALEVSVGRVAAASLGVSDRTKVRSVLGWTEPTTEVTLPLMQGSGQAELLLLSTSGESIRFGATALSEGQPSPAGRLTEQEHGPAAARAYPIPVEPGPTAIRLFTLEDARVVGALRVRGPGEDLGATGGAVAASDAWLVLPAVSRALSTRAVLVNDGDADVVATVRLLPQEGSTVAAPVTVHVPAHSAAAVPPDFWASTSGAAMLVRSEGGPLVALAASTSGRAGAFALSMGVPLPPGPSASVGEGVAP
jgi:hypothetical protein